MRSVACIQLCLLLLGVPHLDALQADSALEKSKPTSDLKKAASHAKHSAESGHKSGVLSHHNSSAKPAKLQTSKAAGQHKASATGAAKHTHVQQHKMKAEAADHKAKSASLHKHAQHGGAKAGATAESKLQLHAKGHATAQHKAKARAKGEHASKAEGKVEHASKAHAASKSKHAAKAEGKGQHKA